MSNWFSSESERQVQDMKARYMTNILQYNKHVMEDKQRRKQKQFQDFEKYSHQNNQEALHILLQENNLSMKRRNQQKNQLKQSYDRQIREKQQRLRREKQKDEQYFYKQKEFIQYEESKRLLQLTKMFNRITYQGVPMNNHKRSKTEPYESESRARNPELNRQSNYRVGDKSLNNIEVGVLPLPQDRKSSTPMNQMGNNDGNLQNANLPLNRNSYY